MPTVLRRDGFRVSIYFNDHRPAHVHVIGAEGEAVFVLNCPHGPTEMRESFGFGRSALNGIEAILAASLPDLCRRWEEIHGE